MLTQKDLELWRKRKLKIHCNECKKEITDRIRTLADGVFCQSCFDTIMNDMQNILGKDKIHIIEDSEKDLPKK